MNNMSRKVSIGNIFVGGGATIKLQSMTNTNTMDTAATIEQVKCIVDAGADIVRITAQGLKEAENLKLIKAELLSQGYSQPIVADIHFNPKAAEISAKYIDKVRINPGNYVDKYRKDKVDFSETEYQAELLRIEERLKPLLEICKTHKTALRIGSNHGSLSQRIMSRYGDSAEGMAQSAMEFLRIAHKHGFDDIVVSMKSSNTRVMIEATKRISQLMEEEQLNYPLHLGVTEAGDALEGRIKSAFGIGALLLQGIGDTIRVSLTESPENELPVCKHIVDCVIKSQLSDYQYIKNIEKILIDGKIGGRKPPVVLATGESIDVNKMYAPDYWTDDLKDVPFRIFNISKAEDVLQIPEAEQVVLMIHGELAFQHQMVRLLNEQQITYPIILHKKRDEEDKVRYSIDMAIELSLFLNYDLIDGIWLENDCLSTEEVLEISFAILQAGRNRMSKTEFIACPSCGRTKFNITEALQRVKAATSHLKTLKIGVMGCIVNGPGEMADADYGYIGAGNGKVSLYKSKTLVKSNVNEDIAIEELINLIKQEGDWEEPEI